MSSEDSYASGAYHFTHRRDMLHAYFELLDSNAPTPYLTSCSSASAFQSPFPMDPMVPHLPLSNSRPLSPGSSLTNCPIARLDEVVHATKFVEPTGEFSHLSLYLSLCGSFRTPETSG
ncbi:hypothetical protein SprV_0501978100 [Sparganum proliferum]